MPPKKNKKTSNKNPSLERWAQLMKAEVNELYRDIETSIWCRIRCDLQENRHEWTTQLFQFFNKHLEPRLKTIEAKLESIRAGNILRNEVKVPFKADVKQMKSAAQL